MLDSKRQKEVIKIAAEVLGKAHHEVLMQASAGDGSHVVTVVSIAFVLETDPETKGTYLTGKAVIMEPNAPRKAVGTELMKLGLHMSGHPLISLLDGTKTEEMEMLVDLPGLRKDGTV